MNDLISNLNKIFKNALKQLNYNYDEDNLVQECSISKLGDFQCNVCLSLAKVYKKSPMQLANEILDIVKANSIIENCSVVAGYINFFVSKEVLNENLTYSYNNFNKKIKYANENLL